MRCSYGDCLVTCRIVRVAGSYECGENVQQTPVNPRSYPVMLSRPSSAATTLYFVPVGSRTCLAWESRKLGHQCSRSGSISCFRMTNFGRGLLIPESISSRGAITVPGCFIAPSHLLAQEEPEGHVKRRRHALFLGRGGGGGGGVHRGGNVISTSTICDQTCCQACSIQQSDRQPGFQMVKADLQPMHVASIDERCGLNSAASPHGRD